MKSLALLLAIDLVWINVVMKPIFEKQVRLVQGGRAMKMNYVAAVLSYGFIAALYYVFVVKAKASPLKAFLLGLFVYGVYEATTMAVLQDWKWSTVFIDTLWGGVLFWLTTVLARRLF